jgi:radical SAM superfamily enzyme YgiQ (UPF0313 family)
MSLKPYVYPMGLAYIAAVLRQNGYEVSILDVNAYRWSQDEVMRCVSQKSFDVLGIGGLVTTYNYVKWFSYAAKQLYPQFPIVIGGSVASPMPEFVLRHTDADIAVLGEGEFTMLDLLTGLNAGAAPETIDGIC